mmetsp:Transcript_34151/g.79357  ORF Transcript_34151/g.79357 Transcript_34151/m.79357 type:complete len:280 (-) Transcript_34151:7-846(-)
MRPELGQSTVLDQGKCELLDLHRTLSIDIRPSSHLRDARSRAELQQLHLHDEGVARNHWPTELDAFDSCEEELTFAVGDRVLQAHEPAKLSHGLHHQDAGHDGPVREVASELRLVGSHVLHAHNLLSRLERHNLVHEKEGVSVGQHLRHCNVVHDQWHSFRQLGVVLGPLELLLSVCLAARPGPHLGHSCGRGCTKRHEAANASTCGQAVAWCLLRSAPSTQGRRRRQVPWGCHGREGPRQHGSDSCHSESAAKGPQQRARAWHEGFSLSSHSEEAPRP